MKKITFFILLVLGLSNLEAQIVYQTVLTDNFETNNGYPSNFTVKAQSAWTTLNTTNNPYPYTGTIWKDVFSDVKPASKKTYVTSIVAENRSGGTGSQCLRFDIKNETFTDVAPNDTVNALRWRGLDNKISFNTDAGESMSKYEVSFWARTDGSDKDVIMNVKSPLAAFKLTSNWQKFTIDRYATGTTSTALGVDFVNTLYPALDNTTGYVVYIDEFVVKQRKIAYTTAASAVVSNGFTANWAAVAGANAYSVIVEKSDGGTTPVWTAVAGSPFTAGNVTSYNVAALDAGATYRYRVTATDGSITTVESNNTFATTSVVSGIETIRNINNIRVDNGNLKLMVDAGKIIDVFNAIGVKQHSIVSNGNETVIQLTNKGIFIVKVGSESRKITF